MKRSTDRILTTHTGSLPRPKRVVDAMLAEHKEPGRHKAELDAAVHEAVRHVIARQIESGIDAFENGIDVPATQLRRERQRCVVARIVEQFVEAEANVAQWSPV